MKFESNDIGLSFTGTKYLGPRQLEAVPAVDNLSSRFVRV